ncbi:MAG: dihydropteroate synthase, partial [Dehalococcoidales bacterium]|nr:dihydropteroate synthase [Dehalococcoidales bacterium]
MEVAETALKAGAAMINDVTGLERDDKLAGVAGRAGVPVVLVSNQRERPGNYDIMAEVISSLERSIGLALEKGVATQNII